VSGELVVTNMLAYGSSSVSGAHGSPRGNCRAWMSAERPRARGLTFSCTRRAGEPSATRPYELVNTAATAVARTHRDIAGTTAAAIFTGAESRPIPNKSCGWPLSMRHPPRGDLTVDRDGSECLSDAAGRISHWRPTDHPPAARVLARPAVTGDVGRLVTSRRQRGGRSAERVGRPGRRIDAPTPTRNMPRQCLRHSLVRRFHLRTWST